MNGPVMSRDEVAQLLGIHPESVRTVMLRHNIKHGYPRDQVLALIDDQGKRIRTYRRKNSIGLSKPHR
jgi:hypothetical protein